MSISRYALITRFKIYWLENNNMNDSFTTEDIKRFVGLYDLKNGKTGEEYSDKTIACLLTNADIKNAGSSNRNKKFLVSEKSSSGRTKYWFDPRFTI